ncbi:hypothetical protein JO861_24050 [Rhodococcus hoagii]|uniref:hypothetical protein n=1 Tax=Rhodococcus hoagii TaxID=43767 RepID=UPI001965140F|nr:hypothetical protein [Prescottella equi]MBM9839628.1 hypothetical protein [Prescottella equi]
MKGLQVKDPLPIVGMVVMGIAAVAAAAVSWVGWPDMVGTLEEAIGPNRRPSVATKEMVAAGIPVLLAVLAVLPWPLLRADRRIERAGGEYRLSGADARSRARGLSIVWCGLAAVLVSLHVCLVGEMTGRTMPMYEVLAVAFGVFLMTFAYAIPHFRRDPASIPQSLRAAADRLDRGYRRAVPILRATAAVTVVLGVLWPIAALVVGTVGMCSALLVAATSGTAES